MAESSQWILDRLESVLREQDGYFTVAQARQLGVDTARIARLLDDERIRRVRPRVYAMTDFAPIPRVPERIYSAWLAIDDKRLPWERHTPFTAVSHVTAAALLGVGTIPDDDDVFLTVVAGSGRTRLDGIQLSLSMLDVDDWRWQREHRIIVTSPARTIADLVVAGIEHDYVLRAASDALQLPGTSRTELDAALTRHPRGSFKRHEWYRRWLQEESH